ncbi:MAG: hypothetical protein H3C58_10140 [Fimbriimonadaceae bacterium]|nr:hypothetical protein [Fimbriimonadaceae bacterium]
MAVPQLAQVATPDAKPWIEALAPLDAPVLVDLPPSVPAPYVGEAIKTREGLDLFAAALMREVVEVNGAFVLAQSRSLELRPGTDRFVATSHWLATEPESVQRQMVEGFMDAREINELGKRTLALCIAHVPSLVTKLAAGELVQLRIGASLHADITTVRDGVATTQRVWLPAGRAFEEHEQFAQPGASEAAKPFVQSGSVIEPVKDGEWDFGEGKVMPVRLLATEAGARWNMRFRMDARLLDEYVFIKGRFGKERFTRSLERIGSALAFGAFDNSEEDPREVARATKDRLLKQVVEKMPDKLRQLFERSLEGPPAGSLTVSDLSACDPKWAARLARMGIPADARVTLSKPMVGVLVWGDPFGGAFAPNHNSIPITSFRF